MDCELIIIASTNHCFLHNLIDFLEANYGEPLAEDIRHNQQALIRSEGAVLGITASDTSTQLQIVGADDVEDCNGRLAQVRIAITMPSTQSKLPSLAENTQSQNLSIDDLLKERDLSLPEGKIKKSLEN